MRLGLSALVLASAAIQIASAQKVSPLSVPARPAPVRTHQEILLPIAGLSSENRMLMMLNNNRSAGTVVSITAYTTDGSAFNLPDMSLVSRESRLAELAPNLINFGLQGRKLGYLRITYDGLIMEVGAQLTLYPTADGSGLDSPRSLAVDYKTTQRSAAFAASKNAVVRIALTNAGSSEVSGTLRCGGLLEPIALAPQNTLIQNIPFGGNPLTSAVPREDACDITYQGAPADLRVFGYVIDGAYSAPLRFYDPASATSQNLTAVALQTDAYTLAVVHNTSAQPVTIHPALRESSLTKLDARPLAERVLGPYSSAMLELDTTLTSMKHDGATLATLTIETTAAKGALVGSLTQVDSSAMVEDIPLRTSNPPAFDRGSYPLRWSDDYANQVSIANTSEENLGYRAVITAGDQIYVLPKGTLAPYATKIFDVDAMRKEGIKDMNGHLLPSDAPYGKFLWSELSDGKNSGLLGRTSLTSVTNHRRSSFSCGENCAVYYDDYPIVSIAGVAVPYQSLTTGTAYERYSSDNQPEYDYPISNFAPDSSNEGVVSFAQDPNDAATFDINGTGVGSTTLSWVTYFNSAGYAGVQGQDSCFSQNNVMAEGAPMATVPTVSISGPDVITAGAITTYQVSATGNQPGGTYVFSVSNNSATLSNTTSSTSSTTNISGNASGSVIVSVVYTLNGQDSSPATKSITVLKVDRLLVRDDSSYTVSCGASGSILGAGRNLDYQMKSGPTTITDAINIFETFSPPPTKNSCGGGITTTYTPTDSRKLAPGNGTEFIDQLLICGVSATQSCHYTATNQKWNQQNSNGSTSVMGSIGTITLDSINGATVNGYDKSIDLTGTVFLP